MIVGKEENLLSVKFAASAQLPTQWGHFTIHGFNDEATGKEHVALVHGELNSDSAILCRVHSECLTGDCLFSLRCDCGPQLQYAMQSIVAAGSGIILYLRQEGRGIGLLNKIRAYELQDSGADTVEANEQLGFDADGREYEICKPMFDHFSISNVKLMTNNPRKVSALDAMGVTVAEIVPIRTGANPHNESYLAVKIDKLGHIK
ncbi:MAG: GTP cyclohydrolase II [Pseudohongiellaceae bacterium]|jgi:GTP cyclohydrolase II